MNWQKYPKSSLALLFFVTVLASWLFWEWHDLTPPPPPREATPYEILGKKESCMGCHDNYTGFAPVHSPEIIGCTPCHRGNPYAADSARAHQDMILVPGNLSDVHQTCGNPNCHGAIAKRVEKSLMASMSGAITVNRFVFGDVDTLSAHAHVKDLGLAIASDVHFRQLCASCHLGNPKIEPAPVHELSRGGGCIACHLDYSGNKNFSAKKTSKDKIFHPAINLKVTNDHCFGCHSRSGRISTNYEGWHETLISEEDYHQQPGFRLLQDGRVFEAMPPDVHHELGLECIDCHSANELMGDGQLYFHEEDAVKISCEDCHFNETPKTVAYDSLDVESQKIINLRKQYKKGQAYVVGEKSKQGIWNVTIDSSGQAFLSQKNSGQQHQLSEPTDACVRGEAHDALSCSACHTGWAPQCIGCHNTFEADTWAFDHMEKEKTQGKWIEHLGVFFAEPPTLGVVIDEAQKRKIKAFIPGMVLSIDKFGFPDKDPTPTLFHRLFAPVAPHTTQKDGRSCVSCHNNPLAIGYGRGELKYDVDAQKGFWSFDPAYVDEPTDGLPQDAWIGFLQEGNTYAATRHNARPFDIAEQQSILTVGACLNCHDGNSKIMQDAVLDFKEVKSRLSEQCVLPDFRVERAN